LIVVAKMMANFNLAKFRALQQGNKAK